MSCALIDAARQTSVQTDDLTLAGTIEFNNPPRLSDGGSFVAIVDPTTLAADRTFTLLDPGADANILDSESDWTATGDVIFTGTVDLQGITTITETGGLLIDDVYFILDANNVGAAVDADIFVERGSSGADATLHYDAAGNVWQAGNVGDVSTILLASDIGSSGSVQAYDAVLDTYAAHDPNANAIDWLVSGTEADLNTAIGTTIADQDWVNANFIDVVATPTVGSFPQLDAAGNLVNTAYDETSFDAAGDATSAVSTHDALNTAHGLTANEWSVIQEIDDAAVVNADFDRLAASTVFGGSLLAAADAEAAGHILDTPFNDTVAKSSTDTITEDPGTVFICDASAASFTLTLPLSSSITDGQSYIFKLTDTSSGTYTCTVEGNGAETIDDAANFVMSNDQEFLIVTQHNGAWYVTSNPGVGASGTDHGALTGLGDDDHTAYHNDTRGDLRYYTQTEIGAVGAGTEGATLIGMGGLTNLSGATVDAVLNTIDTGWDETNWDLASDHIGADGSSHTFINQDVTTTGNPQFASIELSAAGATTLTGAAGVLSVEGTAVMMVGDEPTSHTHDDRYYTETELGAVGAGTEGATLIGMGGLSNLTGATVDAVLNTIDTGWDETNWDLAAGHISADGSSHTFISQDVTESGNPQFATVELGAAADTTLTRVSPGLIAVEGENLATQTYADAAVTTHDGAASPHGIPATGLASLSVLDNSVSGGQWDYLGGMDQEVKIGSDVSYGIVSYDFLDAGTFASTTISSGVLTATGNASVAGEGAAADILNTLTVSGVAAGYQVDLIFDQHDITVTKTGNITWLGRDTIVMVASEGAIGNFEYDGAKWQFINASSLSGGGIQRVKEEYNTGMAARTDFDLTGSRIVFGADATEMANYVDFRLNGIELTTIGGEWYVGTNVTLGDRIVYDPDTSPALVTGDVVEIVYWY